VPLNGLKYFNREIRALSMLQMLGGIQGLEMRREIQKFMKWGPETME
jgi:hypothetical protein